MKKAFPVVLIVFFFLSCTSEKPAPKESGGSSDANTGIYALALAPKEATRKTTLSLSARGFDLSRARIDWSINGSPFTTEVPTQLNGTDATKGDDIQATATFDGHKVQSNVVTIMNSLPEITRIKIMPEVFKPGDTLNVEVSGADADEDDVTFQYEWTVNGEPSGSGAALDKTLKRGDRISVKVTPFDGTEYGTPAILDREIRNMPPVIAENNNFTFDGTVYKYQVMASDLDGDPLTYSLESPPEGMSIDKTSGLITWNVPEQFKGKKDASVSVSDGHGGVARYVVHITIQ